MFGCLFHFQTANSISTYPQAPINAQMRSMIITQARATQLVVCGLRANCKWLFHAPQVSTAFTSLAPHTSPHHRYKHPSRSCHHISLLPAAAAVLPFPRTARVPRISYHFQLLLSPVSLGRIVGIRPQLLRNWTAMILASNSYLNITTDKR